MTIPLPAGAALGHTKLESTVPKAATRTRDALWDTIGTLLDAFPPDECQRYTTNSGYEFV